MLLVFLGQGGRVDGMLWDIGWVGETKTGVLAAQLQIAYLAPHRECSLTSAAFLNKLVITLFWCLGGLGLAGRSL